MIGLMEPDDGAVAAQLKGFPLLSGGNCQNCARR